MYEVWNCEQLWQVCVTLLFIYLKSSSVIFSFCDFWRNLEIQFKSLVNCAGIPRKLTKRIVLPVASLGLSRACWVASQC